MLWPRIFRSWSKLKICHVDDCTPELISEFGCYPDSFRDIGVTYNFSKPPVHGWAFAEMLRRMPTPPSRESAGIT